MNNISQQLKENQADLAELRRTTTDCFDTLERGYRGKDLRDYKLLQYKTSNAVLCKNDQSMATEANGKVVMTRPMDDKEKSDPSSAEDE
ncbi:hypothetical protein M5K25_002981 [Dendrobium thyrsiflorum]|uniref:Uncharacterized protein n=1 Tax=Dendrobium thyrsiflorum TaxID=117978 RepID=A0ABD0VWE7_DENTH